MVRDSIGGNATSTRSWLYFLRTDYGKIIKRKNEQSVGVFLFFALSLFSDYEVFQPQPVANKTQLFPTIFVFQFITSPTIDVLTTQNREICFKLICSFGVFIKIGIWYESPECSNQLPTILQIF